MQNRLRRHKILTTDVRNHEADFEQEPSKPHLRKDSMCRMQYMMNTTLISGFEKAEVGDEVFDQISNVDQPCWNYTMFMFHIWVTLSYTATASAHHVMSCSDVPFI